MKVEITSAGFAITKNDRYPIKISVNNEDFSVNHRGINIVVWDIKENKMVDSICFDVFDKNKAYRKSGSKYWSEKI